LAHPEARYFDVGRITVEQLTDYAQRKTLSVEQVSALLCKNI
jgi:5-methyltetrahydrofolate--homocysteine methyltransferase